ncbi:MAG: hypothetical protein ACUVRS_08195 [Armatimonadota bacterium]
MPLFLPRLYSRENVPRVKFLQIIVAVITAGVCSYLMLQSFIVVSRSSNTERLLRRAKQNAASLSRELASEREREARKIPHSQGGIDAFAVELDRWARQEGVRVGSFVPEGTPTASEIVVNGLKLGVWNAYKVRVKGSGRYECLMRLLNRFRRPNMPVKLDSFSLQAASHAGDTPAVGFDLVFTVYERKESS